MQSTDQRTWIGDVGHKLVLIAVGITAILLSWAVVDAFGTTNERASISRPDTMAADSFTARNLRFLDFNVLPEAATAAASGRERLSLEHYRFLDMNLLPDDTVSGPAVPIQMGRPH